MHVTYDLGVEGTDLELVDPGQVHVEHVLLIGMDRDPGRRRAWAACNNTSL